MTMNSRCCFAEFQRFASLFPHHLHEERGVEVRAEPRVNGISCRVIVPLGNLYSSITSVLRPLFQ